MSVAIKGNAISLTRGDTLKVTVKITQGDGSEEYTPKDGDHIRFALKKKITDPEPLILKSIPNDTMLLVIDPEDTKSLEFGKYKYDIELTKENGDVCTFIGPDIFSLTEEVH